MKNAKISRYTVPGAHNIQHLVLCTFASVIDDYYNQHGFKGLPCTQLRENVAFHISSPCYIFLLLSHTVTLEGTGPDPSSSASASEAANTYISGSKGGSKVQWEVQLTSNKPIPKYSAWDGFLANHELFNLMAQL